MSKNIFYKIKVFEAADPNMKMSRNNRVRVVNPEITHNIPEEYVVNIEEFGHCLNTFEHNSYTTWRYLYLKTEQFEKIKNRLFYLNDSIHYSKHQYGCILLRCERGDIACQLSLTNENNKDYIVLYPVSYIYNDTNIRYEMGDLPARNVKVFFSKEDKDNYNDSQSEKKKKKDAEDFKKLENVRKSNPEFDFTTPKMKILNIAFKSDWLKDVKVGDVIYGKLPIITRREDGHLEGNLHGGMSYTNYVKVYINDKFVCEISPLTFQTLFQINYIIEII